MIATWMLYCIAVSLLLGLAALALEHGLRVRDWLPTPPYLRFSGCLKTRVTSVMKRRAEPIGTIRWWSGRLQAKAHSGVSLVSCSRGLPSCC